MDKFLDNGIILCDSPKIKRKTFYFHQVKPSGIKVIITCRSLELSVFECGHYGHPITWDKFYFKKNEEDEKEYILWCKNESDFITIKEFEKRYNVSVVIENIGPEENVETQIPPVLKFLQFRNPEVQKWENPY